MASEPVRKPRSSNRRRSASSESGAGAWRPTGNVIPPKICSASGRRKCGPKDGRKLTLRATIATFPYLVKERLITCQGQVEMSFMSSDLKSSAEFDAAAVRELTSGHRIIEGKVRI